MFIQSIFNSTLPQFHSFIHFSDNICSSTSQMSYLEYEFPPGHGHRNKSPQSPEKSMKEAFVR